LFLDKLQSSTDLGYHDFEFVEGSGSIFDFRENKMFTEYFLLSRRLIALPTTYLHTHTYTHTHTHTHTHSISTHPKINDVRLNVPELSFLRKMPLLHALSKGAWLVLSLVWTLLSIPAYDVILIQTPPALPGMCVRHVCAYGSG